jgi:hypothetical protein
MGELIEATDGDHSPVTGHRAILDAGDRLDLSSLNQQSCAIFVGHRQFQMVKQAGAIRVACELILKCHRKY